MNFLSIILVLGIGGGWILLATLISFQFRHQVGWKRILPFVSSTLLIAGGGGFFASALSATGGLKQLADNFEWPAGYCTGVYTMPQGVHIVPLAPSGRIQIYSADWSFIKGWSIEGNGKPIDIVPAGGETFHVYSAAGPRHQLFDPQGSVLFEEKSESRLNQPQYTGQKLMVPTRWWLWIFSSPILSWLTGMAGMLILVQLHSKRRRR